MVLQSTGSIAFLNIRTEFEMGTAVSVRKHAYFFPSGPPYFIGRLRGVAKPNYNSYPHLNLSSSNASGYEVFRSTTYDNLNQCEAFRVFDGIIGGESINNFWHSQYGAFNSGNYVGTNSTDGYNGEWVTLKLPFPVVIQHFTITVPSRSITTIRSPRLFRFYGGNNNSTWTTLFDQNTVVTNWTSGGSKTYALTTTGLYQYYRLAINKVGNTSELESRNVEIGELKLLTGLPQVLTLTSANHPGTQFIQEFNIVTFTVPSFVSCQSIQYSLTYSKQSTMYGLDYINVALYDTVTSTTVPNTTATGTGILYTGGTGSINTTLSNPSITLIASRTYAVRIYWHSPGAYFNSISTSVTINYTR